MHVGTRRLGGMASAITLKSMTDMRVMPFSPGNQSILVCIQMIKGSVDLSQEAHTTGRQHTMIV